MLESKFKQRRENQKLDEFKKERGVKRNEMKKREYKNKVVFMRKSKEGHHLYAFNNDGVLGGGVKSVLVNVSDVEKLLGGEYESIKVSIMPSDEEALDRRVEEEFGEELEGK